MIWFNLLKSALAGVGTVAIVQLVVDSLRLQNFALRRGDYTVVIVGRTSGKAVTVHIEKPHCARCAADGALKITRDTWQMHSFPQEHLGIVAVFKGMQDNLLPNRIGEQHDA